jgi:outer membrane protein OmpA-like peptidoglycan-associated protein
MRKFVSPSLVMLLIAGLTLTGCATKEFVREEIAASEQRGDAKIGEVQGSVEQNQKAIGDLQTKDAEIEKKLAELSDTAKDALKRAEEAGKLAKGKFLYEVTLTDNDVRFGFDKAELSPEAKAALDAFAAKVKAENRAVYIEIQGHTDHIGSEAYNLELGYARANKAMQYLRADHGFPLHRMNVISYGEFKPIADNNTKDGRAQNRRVTMVVLE